MVRRKVVQPQEPTKRPSEDDSDQCYVCTMNRLFSLGLYLGFMPLDWTCPHQDPPHKAQVVHSRLAHTVYSILSCIYLSLFVCNLYFIAASDMVYEKLKLLYLCIDTVHVSVGAFTSLLSLIGIRKKIAEINGIIKIIENRAMYGIDVVYSPQLKVKINRMALPVTFISIVLSTALIIMNLIATPEEDQSMLFYIQIFLANFGMHTLIVTLVQLVASCLTYNAFFKEMHNNLTKVLMPYRKPVDPEDFMPMKVLQFDKFDVKKFNQVPNQYARASVVGKFENLSLASRLRKFRKLYAAFIWNIKIMNAQYNPTMLIGVTLIITSIVLNIYLFLMPFFDSEMWSLRTFDTILSLLHCVILAYLFFGSADDLRFRVDKITGYLFGFPIGGLEAEEAEQLEGLLELLNSQPPVFNASGVFDIKMSLVASIAGTVCTYVLVALQFQVNWLLKPPTGNGTSIRH